MYSSVLVVVDVVKVNMTMGAGMCSLVVDAVVVDACICCILFRCKEQQSCTCGSIYMDAMTVDTHVKSRCCGQIGGEG